MRESSNLWQQMTADTACTIVAASGRRLEVRGTAMVPPGKVSFPVSLQATVVALLLHLAACLGQGAHQSSGPSKQHFEQLQLPARGEPHSSQLSGYVAHQLPPHGYVLGASATPGQQGAVVEYVQAPQPPPEGVQVIYAYPGSAPGHHSMSGAQVAQTAQPGSTGQQQVYHIYHVPQSEHSAGSALQLPAGIPHDANVIIVNSPAQAASVQEMLQLQQQEHHPHNQQQQQAPQPQSQQQFQEHQYYQQQQQHQQQHPPQQQRQQQFQEQHQLQQHPQSQQHPQPQQQQQLQQKHASTNQHLDSLVPPEFLANQLNKILGRTNPQAGPPFLYSSANAQQGPQFQSVGYSKGPNSAGPFADSRALAAMPVSGPPHSSHVAQPPSSHSQLSSQQLLQLYQQLHSRGTGQGGQPMQQLAEAEQMSPQCPHLREGEGCRGVFHGCHQHTQCEAGTACCPDACGMVCKRIVAASRGNRMLPGSMLVQSCLDSNCSRRGDISHHQCDAEHSCAAGNLCCFDGCTNICKYQNGALFGGRGGKMNMRDMSMLMLLSGGT